MPEERSSASLRDLEDAAESARERVAALEADRDRVVAEKHDLQIEIERAKGRAVVARERLADNAEQLERNERAAQSGWIMHIVNLLHEGNHRPRYVRRASSLNTGWK